MNAQKPNDEFEAFEGGATFTAKIEDDEVLALIRELKALGAKARRKVNNNTLVSALIRRGHPILKREFEQMIEKENKGTA